jgi:hypothetical protein
MTAYAFTSPVPPAVAMIPLTQEDCDDDDDDHRMVTGGPFENAKRMSSWSATSMRKELGSPRIVAHGNNNSKNMFPFENSDNDNDNDNNPTQAAFPAIQTTTATAPANPRAMATSVPVKSEDFQPRVSHTKKERSNSRATGPSFLQELGSALVSCSGASRTRTRDMTRTMSPNWVLLRDSWQKAVKGDLDAANCKEAWPWRRSSADESPSCYNPASVSSAGSRDDSIITNDNHTSHCSLRQQKLALEKEEAMQIRRLTSWGTVGTYETLDSAGYAFHSAYYKNNNVMATNNNHTPQGPPATTTTTVEHSVKHLHLHTKAQTTPTSPRKKVVRFDYPPISSLRECPRTRPDQIGELFFTEHELEQIEDDRYCTISADDVEIVAISTSNTAESDTNNSTNNKHSNNPKSPSSASNNSAELDATLFQNYVSTPAAAQNYKHNNNLNHNQKKDSKKLWLRNFSFDEMVHPGRNNTNTKQPQETFPPKNPSSRRASRPSATLASSASMNTATSTESPSSPAANTTGSKRIIKSVQIYLRERSIG